MRFLIAASLLVGLAVASPEFQAFKAEYGKVYSGRSEEQMRMAIFNANLKKINEHNSRPGVSYKMGINQFTDMTQKEFKATLGYHVLDRPEIPLASNPESKVNIKDLPKSVDWRERGSVTSPKNQGHCGSCWAFATVEQVESYVHITNGTLLELSSQQVTSCTPNPLACGGTGGCYGSIPQLGFTYIQLFGLVKESDYPYVSGTTQQTEDCTYDPHKTPAAATLRGYEKLPTNDMAAVMNHIAHVGPLVIAVDASAFGAYSSGVFDGCDFDKNIDLNHAVQLVGYGTDEKLGDYWLVRNSWGEKYGENGYIRLKRNSETKCGTDMTPSHGVACNNDGQSTQHVCGTCGILFDTAYPIGAQLL